MIAVIAPQSARPSTLIIAVAVAHDERAEVGVAEAEGAENVGVLRDLLDRIAGVIDEDFLRGDEDAHRRFESLDIERAVRALELHQVQRSEIAGGVIEEQIFRARIGGILLGSVPLQVCHLWMVASNCIPGSPQIMCAFGDFVAASVRASFRSQRLAVVHAARPPFAAFDRGLHELVAHAHADRFSF